MRISEWAAPSGSEKRGGAGMSERDHHGCCLEDALRSGRRERPFELREDLVLFDDTVILGAHVFCVDDALRRLSF